MLYSYSELNAVITDDTGRDIQKIVYAVCVCCLSVITEAFGAFVEILFTYAECCNNIPFNWITRKYQLINWQHTIQIR